jgi:tetratricopeptide (TPR) repeat protein
MDLGHRLSKYDTALLERILRYAKPGTPAHAAAAKTLLTFRAKTGASRPELEPLARITSAYMENRESSGRVTDEIRWSAHYRNICFLPYVEGALSETEALMSKSDNHARNALEKAETDEEQYLALDNFSSMAETYARVVAQQGDVHGAIGWLEQVVDVDGTDPKARILLGEYLFRAGRYQDAAIQFGYGARFGPPGTALSFYLEGKCWELSGDQMSAAQAYNWSLRADPNGISSASALAATASKLGIEPLAAWAQARATELEGRMVQP